jgi:hypothetical protein
MSVSTRNRSLILAAKSVWTVIALAGFLRAEQMLPVFLADNHAETFGWITRTFDPDDRYQLILVDAHSDASAAERSEEIREQLRRVASLEARAARVEEWRKNGRIQAFNWIEPLMPRPIDRVLWLRPTADELPKSTAEAVESLDGRLEVEPRSAGSFEGRWTTVNPAGFQTWKPGGERIILSIDLDYFAGMEPEARYREFEAIWQHAMNWPGLEGVAFCVSRPWLKNDAEADALVTMATDAVSRTRGATLEMDASIDDRPDASALAGKSQQPLSRWDAAHASAALRERWFHLGDRLRITDRKRSWNDIRDGWVSRGFQIAPDHGEADCDGIWRFPINEPPVLRVDSAREASGRVRWFILEPSNVAYDLWPETRLGKNFATSPGRWIYETRRSLGETHDFALTADKWKPEGLGRARIQAEVETSDGWLPAPPVEVRLTDGSGFHASLSECFGMPYAFGIAGVADAGLTGVESGWGSDCSNFLIHAWRRNGIAMPWGDPGRLRSNLSTLAEHLTPTDRPAILTDDVRRGIVIDFGQHVAALWEDREPVGTLDGNDLLAHHLGGFPEIVTLSELAKNRPAFALRTPRMPGAAVDVRIAGDVVMAGEERVSMPEFERRGADLFLANLEGVPSLKAPEHAPRHDFRFPPERLAWLREKGVDAVSLANNHAGDAGRDGLLEAMEALRSHKIGFCGAGRNSAEACRPWKTDSGGVRIAVFGISLVDALAATDDQPGVAQLPGHQGLLERELRDSINRGEKVFVLLHAGDEYRTPVNDSQRRWARWLAQLGVSVIAGSHPHVVQREETFAGARIHHSLGNAVYPKSLKGTDSGAVVTFRIHEP